VSTRRTFEVIAFDGDDTLWHNERGYRESRDAFQTILADAGIILDDEALEAAINDVEMRNLAFYGYGVPSFVLSLIEAAIGLSEGGITGHHIDEIIELARRMITADVELFPGVLPTLRALSREYPLMLITKGDLLHQRSKLSRSGLERHFRFVEVVSHKTPEVYQAILTRHGIQPSRFLMVGNSMRSDVLPVVEVGGWAVHVPAALSWSHEHAQPTDSARHRFFERTSLEGLAPFVRALAMRLERTNVKVRGKRSRKTVPRRVRRGPAARRRSR
jgi:putative hydrolase of the HAD superfamily